ncbi:MAG: hypothetical protein IPN22_15035 [Bacteroidetes bacterium]|nr:hypothetical protein [Bacteroidota bacterium]
MVDVNVYLRLPAAASIGCGNCIGASWAAFSWMLFTVAVDAADMLVPALFVQFN